MAELKITGSFFDLQHVNIWDQAYWTDECRFWQEANWRALMREMRTIGIDTAICTNTALWGRPMFPGYEKTVGRQLKMGCADPLGTCVDEADKLGMKLFFGIGLRGRVSQVRDYSNMLPPWPEEWFTWNRALTVALMERYSDHPCFAGFYICYEMDFHDYQIDLYEKLMKEYLRPAVGKVKFLASPGYLGELDDINKLPGYMERTTLNILAPQDYGGRSSDIEEALKLVHRNAEGLRVVGPKLLDIGVTLWANCEVFDFEQSPDGRVYCIPGPIERIKEQVAIQAPLVEKLICYQYQGIMNRHTDLVNIGRGDTDILYRDYVDYVKSIK
ncbi:MAG: DUF4434 domain-containing protein [Phycisphaerae bacterium]